ncbi:uncharacterized protein AB675_11588 [Cyphellophora attinorum]|uniref:Carboxylic ester hydrolase n=1 Tax=Cyphellophora attinorum TaxID=1664694 RepID=A0A0N1HTM4_9EURO|nr:uncharacterized protein AB675_11588 [Phialophora attinorum]KPI39932.1 hypothetical protein AB675_11588 [Phialophora attinorum]
MLAGYLVVLLAQSTMISAQGPLGSFNIEPSSISVSGFSSGGFMAAQLGIAYSSLFQSGFGVFAGGPYDCARDQDNFQNCMFNATPMITQPIANVKSFGADGSIDPLTNLLDRRVYLQAGALDDVIGLSITNLLHLQLLQFTKAENVVFVTLADAGHAMPTDQDSKVEGFSPCNESISPYISNCGYDGAGAVLKWLYGNLNERNDLIEGSGSLTPFLQTGPLGAPGLADTGYIYIPETCQRRHQQQHHAAPHTDDGHFPRPRSRSPPPPRPCKLHLALHGCTMNVQTIGDLFIAHAGYNAWADTNDMIVLYPQTTTDNETYDTWSGHIANENACFDWIGQYGDSDRRLDSGGGEHMRAIVAMVRRVAGLDEEAQSGKGKDDEERLRAWGRSWDELETRQPTPQPQPRMPVSYKWWHMIVP